MLHKFREFEITLLHHENHDVNIAVGYQGEELTKVFYFYQIKPLLS